MLHPVTVSEQPPLIVHGFSEVIPPDYALSSIEIMDGRIAIDLRKTQVGLRFGLYAVLASVGMSNDEIGTVTHRSPGTIKSHLQRLFDNNGVNGRANIAEWMFDLGAYRVAQTATSPRLSPREQQVMQLVSTGRANKSIGDALFISENTVKTHMRRITDKLGFADRAAVALASFAIQKPIQQEPAA